MIPRVRGLIVYFLLVSGAAQASSVSVSKIDSDQIEVITSETIAGDRANTEPSRPSPVSKVPEGPTIVAETNRPCGVEQLPVNECPQPNPNAPNTPTPAPEFTDADARQAATQITLPPPQPDIRPGLALCGLPMYLTIAGPGTYTSGHTIGGWTATFHNTLTNYDINWGDNTPNTTTTSRGAPYPHGDITHYWTTRGTYTITVTAQWTANWTATHPTAGARNGTINNLQTTNTINEFPVRELQAFITA